MSENIKIADKSDVKIIAELAKELWPNHDLDDLIKTFD